MFSKTVTQASTSFSDMDLVTCVAFYSIHHVFSLTQVYFDLKWLRPLGISKNVEVLVWRQVLQRDRPQGNLPRSLSTEVGLVRVLLTR